MRKPGNSNQNKGSPRDKHLKTSKISHQSHQKSEENRKKGATTLEKQSINRSVKEARYFVPKRINFLRILGNIFAFPPETRAFFP
jgi:hypothetical protein